MSVPVSLAVTIGPWSVDSASEPLTEIVSVETLARIGSPEAVCRVVLYSPPADGGPQAALTAGAGLSAGLPGGGAPGAAGTTVRGYPIAAGDAIEIDLKAGDASERVATAEVDSIRTSCGAVSVVGGGALQKLASARLTSVYEGQSLDQIVGDLAGRVGVTTGELESRATHPYVLIHESRSVLRNVLDLARREGMDVYQAPDGSLIVKRFEKTGADHVLRYAAEILDVGLTGASAAEQVVAYGESPSSSRGGDTWHWLVKDGSAFSGRAGDGLVTLATQDGAVRNKDAAGALASSLWGGLADRSRLGHVRVLGNPSIKLGDAIEIAECPRSELDGTFKVTSVRHRFSARAGFVTEIGFSGLGGAAAAPIGAGAAAGSVGL